MKILLTRAEAAERLSMSINSFDRYVLHEIRTVRCGRMVLVPASELETWSQEKATR